jgi:hypothetical protein
MSNDISDPQDRAEALDSDELGTADDPSIEPDFPFDRLLGADQFGTTAAEEQLGEPIEERVEREQPDPLVVELEEAQQAEDRSAQGTSIAAALDELELELDEGALAAVDAVGEPELDLEVTDEAGHEAGRLVEGGLERGVTELDLEAQSVASAFDEDDLSAEEAAVHVTDEPPMGPPDDGVA